MKQRIRDSFDRFARNENQKLLELSQLLDLKLPLFALKKKQKKLQHIKKLMFALSPSRWLRRGFLIVTNQKGESIKTINNINKKDILKIQFHDGEVYSTVDSIRAKET